MRLSAPGLRHLTFQSSFLLLGAAAAWTGVVVVARHMGPMPGTMGLEIGSFVAVWALMMTAMMLPSVTPFASLYTRTVTDNRGLRLLGLALGYLAVWALAALPAYGLAWLADRSMGGTLPRRRRWLRASLPPAASTSSRPSRTGASPDAGRLWASS